MYDIIIIGSGPAGLSAAVYATRAQLNTVVIEKDHMGTGQIILSEQVDNYLGIPEINGFDLGVKFREHAISFGAEFYEGEVKEMISRKDGYTIKCADGKAMESRAVIYAAGTSYRRLDIPGNTLSGVSYCAVCDGMFYKDKVTAVVGGGDTALGDAAYLSKIAKKVYLIHRREEFRANKALQEKVKSAPNIELVLNAEVTKINGEKRVEALEIIQSGEKKVIDVSGIFIAIGSIPNSSLLNDLCSLDKSGYVIAGEDGITSAKGLFAAGDVRTQKLRQVVTAVSDGARCVISAEEYLR